MNPWNEISLDTYEKHMSLANVQQLQAMNRITRAQLSAFRADTVMILGVAGGNGLEHINAGSVKTVYGVDINPDYLCRCSARYPMLSGVLTTICADLTAPGLSLPHAALVIANLLVEYIGYPCLQRAILLVKPQYVSLCIQINEDETFVSDSPYLSAFNGLAAILHPMDADALTLAMREIGYTVCFWEDNLLPNGKKLRRLDYKKS